MELVDTAGRQQVSGTIEEQAQSLGRAQSEKADLIVVCREAGTFFQESGVRGQGCELRTSSFELRAEGRSSKVEVRDPRPSSLDPIVLVGTKCDLGDIPAGWMGTSALTGKGIEELRSLLVEKARCASRSPLAPSLSRCRANLEKCLASLEHAIGLVAMEEPAELLALDIREALEQLDEMLGIAYTEDLLDRIFSRFCIGK